MNNSDRGVSNLPTSVEIAGFGAIIVSTLRLHNTYFLPRWSSKERRAWLALLDRGILSWLYVRGDVQGCCEGAHLIGDVCLGWILTQTFSQPSLFWDGREFTDGWDTVWWLWRCLVQLLGLWFGTARRLSCKLIGLHTWWWYVPSCSQLAVLSIDAFEEHLGDPVWAGGGWVQHEGCDLLCFGPWKLCVGLHGLWKVPLCNLVWMWHEQVSCIPEEVKASPCLVVLSVGSTGVADAVWRHVLTLSCAER